MVFNWLKNLSSSVVTKNNNKDQGNADFYLRKYQYEIKKFEQDRKQTIIEFESSKANKTININNNNNISKNKIEPVENEINNPNKSSESLPHLTNKEEAVIDIKTALEREFNYPKKKDQLKQKFLEWSNSSTAHGIPNIFRIESRILRIIWIICFLAAFAYCSYTIVNIIVVYLQYDVLINQEVVIEAPIDFPVVTVCNLNAFDRIKAKNFIDLTLAKNNISYVTNISSINISPTEVDNLLKASVIGNKNFTTANIQNLGFTIDFMLLTCYFNNVPCNVSDFRWVYDFGYTNCWQFNRLAIYYKMI